jgi:hypothetical protein
VLAFSTKYSAFARESHNDAVYQTIRLEQQFVACLQGRTSGPLSFGDGTFDEASCFAAIVKATFGCGIVFYRIMQQILAFVHGEYAQALEAAGKAEPVLSAAIARIERRDLEAMRLYEEAIQSARENGFAQNEALAYEVGSRFYAERGFPAFAQTYLRSARNAYLRWGALGKVRQIDQENPSLHEERAASAAATIETPVEQLDLATVMKVSQAVSGEIVLEQLIETLMGIVIEHAGAERGLLILPFGEEYRVVAEAKTGRDQVEVRVKQAPVASSALPDSLLRYVLRTQESVILDDAFTQTRSRRVARPNPAAPASSGPDRFSVCLS